ncbi:hypothetical protein LMH87_000827 [Akanthomyces muscarius]|uniref:Uncharacterized protein n=1 Tax=Akanthomyces muscarius TaxID=2231603 RepID=A0A9W8QFT1_AKAMU|nr:hypothetical protein LMH87_000827 [Akanthomyces muscarius]KAJ4155590.1 hypothetical protein LMH87_000827 [Akanthomyces muscarius]
MPSVSSTTEACSYAATRRIAQTAGKLSAAYGIDRTRQRVARLMSVDSACGELTTSPRPTPAARAGSEPSKTI